jgi:hypothetical protein
MLELARASLEQAVGGSGSDSGGTVNIGGKDGLTYSTHASDYGVCVGAVQQAANQLYPETNVVIPAFGPFPGFHVGSDANAPGRAKFTTDNLAKQCGTPGS